MAHDTCRSGMDDNYSVWHIALAASIGINYDDLGWAGSDCNLNPTARVRSLLVTRFARRATPFATLPNRPVSGERVTVHKRPRLPYSECEINTPPAVNCVGRRRHRIPATILSTDGSVVKVTK